MNHYEFVTKEMFVSGTARSAYRTAAALSLTLYLSVPAAFIEGPMTILKALVFVGVLGTALTLVGMEFFLFRFDELPAWKQILWFCLMLFVPLGPALYCFLVYSNATQVKAASANSAKTFLPEPKTKS